MVVLLTNQMQTFVQEVKSAFNWWISVQFCRNLHSWYIKSVLYRHAMMYNHVFTYFVEGKVYQLFKRERYEFLNACA